MPKTNTTEDGEPWVYHGFPESNTTPIPDEFFDVLAPKLTEAELRVALYVMRRTRGFKKSEDAISFSQLVGGIKTRNGRVLDQGTGMSKSAVWRGVNGLVAKGILLKHTALTALGDNETNVYRIHYRGDGGVVLQKNYPGSPEEPPVVLLENTQETVLQETVLHSSNTTTDPKSEHPDRPDSKFRKGSRRILQAREQGPLAAPWPEPSDRPLLGRTTTRGPVVIGEVLRSRGLPVYRAVASAPQQPVTAADSDDYAEGGTTDDPAGVENTVPRAYRTDHQANGRASAAERQSIQAYLGDFAPELGDQAPFQSSVTRLSNLYVDSGLTMPAYVQRLYAARSRTKERYRAIRDRTKRFAYFCALLEEECGLREPPTEIAAVAKATGQRKPSKGAEAPERKSLAGKYYDRVQH